MRTILQVCGASKHAVASSVRHPDPEAAKRRGYDAQSFRKRPMYPYCRWGSDTRHPPRKDVLPQLRWLENPGVDAARM